MSEGLTVRQMQNAICGFSYSSLFHPRQSRVFCNGIFRHWERDMLVVTRANVPVEIEIKRSIADLKKEFCKTRRFYSVRDRGFREEAKWIGDAPCKVARCFIALPAELVEQATEIVPPFVGIIECFYNFSFRTQARIVRKPKTFTVEKVTPSEMIALLERNYHRMWTERWKERE